MNNDLKKTLYRKKPTAYLYSIDSTMQGEIYKYITDVDFYRIIFDVPRHDMGEKVFEPELPAQLLIRWYAGDFQRYEDDYYHKGLSEKKEQQ